MGKTNVKAWLRLALIFMLCLSISGAAMAATLRVGSSGEEVKTLQTKLKRWGYYTGSIDGVFGSGTKKAVIAFQKKNGLTPDGIVGPATLKALGMQSSSGSSASSGSNTNGNLYLLARLVYGEARGEPYKGQVAVAAVVSMTLLATVVSAKMIGCLLPQLAKKMGLDPAVMASPFITTIVDAISLLVYFGIAKLLLF